MSTVNIKDPPYNAVGNGIANDAAAINAALAAAENVYAPEGNYYAPGISLPVGRRLFGDGRSDGGGGTVIQAWHDIVNVVTADRHCVIEKLNIFGKGINNDTGPIMGGPVYANALTLNGVGATVRDCRIWGGYSTIWTTAVDCYFENIDTAMSYGPANLATSGANWYTRCKIDHSPTGIPVTNFVPFPNWAAGASYSVGQVVIINGLWAIQCSSPGVSGALSPAVRNYGVAIPDGSVTWLLLAPAGYRGLLVGTNAGENHFELCDFTGSGYYNAIHIYADGSAPVGPQTIKFDHCVMGANSLIERANWVSLRGCSLSGLVVNSGYNGSALIEGNKNLATANMAFGPGVNNLVVANNDLNGGVIQLNSTNDHYSVANNIRCSITGHVTGANKFVGGNVG